MKKTVKLAMTILILIAIGFIIIKIFNKNDKLIVCIDAGHGGSDVGAESNDRYEKDDTLRVAKLVKKYLEEQDIKVIMTRDNDSSVSLKQRCNIANKKKADLFVSIHRNSALEGNGIEIWINSKKENKDTKLANNILNKIENIEIQSNRGIKYGTAKGENTDYYVLNNTKMPSCLIELGFITDNKDNELLDKNIESYAKAIADGIKEEIKRKD